MWGLSESVFFCSVICLVWVLFEFCLLNPSAFRSPVSLCVSLSCVSSHCFIPQVFSIVCHYLPVSVLFKPQCFSFWLPVCLILFCTFTFLPTPGSNLLRLFSAFPVSGFLFSVFWPLLAWTLFVDFSLWYFLCRTALWFWPLPVFWLSLPDPLNICLWNFILSLCMVLLSLILTRLKCS